MMKHKIVNPPQRTTSEIHRAKFSFIKYNFFVTVFLYHFLESGNCLPKNSKQKTKIKKRNQRRLKADLNILFIYSTNDLFFFCFLLTGCWLIATFIWLW